MIECEKHGLAEAARCCLHVADAAGRGDRLEVFVLFDDYGEATHLCSVCRDAGRSYARQMPRESRLHDYPVESRSVCWEHLNKWHLATAGAELPLFKAEEARTGGRPDRHANAIPVPAAVGVHAVLREGETSVLHVRSHEGVVRCGTEFRQAFGSNRWHREGPATDIRLTVVRIRLYGRDFDRLAKVTACLSRHGLRPYETNLGRVHGWRSVVRAGRVVTFSLLSAPLALALWALCPFPAGELDHRTIASAEYWSRDGVLLRARLNAQGSRCLWRSLAEISPSVRTAFIASEDQRFRQHHGLDVRALARALRDNALGQARSGASTITMQLARQLRPHDPGLLGKVYETLLAVRLEQTLGKDEILEQYLNRVPLGQGVVGVEGAAWMFFGHSSRDLSEPEAALLAGVARAPSRLDPRFHPEGACLAAQRALRRSGSNSLCPKLGRVTQWPNEAQHFVDHLPRTPARWQTTIDVRVQRLAEESLRRNRQRLLLFDAEDAAVVIVDNETGELRAVVGAINSNSRNGQVDASSAERQAGSILKPFLYAMFLEGGGSPDVLLPDWIQGFRVGESVFVPSNANGLYHGLVPLKVALGSSLNVPAVAVLQKVGIEDFAGKLGELGLRRDRPVQLAGMGLALGVEEVSLVAITEAFSVFSRDGVLAAANGLSGRPKERRAFSSDAARNISRILSDETARTLGFGDSVPQGLPPGTTLKTGTSTLSRDFWALAASARWTCGVWVGNVDGRPAQDSFSMATAAPVAAEILARLETQVGGQ